MAEEKVDPREVNLRQLLHWTELFRGFQIALDFKKLLLAVAGIVVMSFGWWCLSALFFTRTVPEWGSTSFNKPEDWNRFKEARKTWNLLYETAGRPLRADGKTDAPTWHKTDANDLAESSEEFDLIRKPIEEAIRAGKQEVTVNGRTLRIADKPYGRLRTLPWFEDRGPNPFLLVTGQTGRVWESGHFWEWFLTQQAPVLVEPLIKFLRPVIYLLNPMAGFLNRLYFLLVIVWTLATWALFGGAITRMAAVQLAGKDKVGLMEALRFVWSRYLGYLSAPLIPLGLVAVIVVFLVVFGFLQGLIPVVGEIFIAGVFWFLVLLAGVVMAGVLVGLVGWPMMYATISSEGSDSFDALSRMYSYVYQCPWHYIWYAVVALVYGAVVVFFVGFMGSLAVYLGKWGLSQAPYFWDRDPAYLFVYAPTSFGWRDLLFQLPPSATSYQEYLETRSWNNLAGAVLVALWLYLAFLLVVGFGYSYFWSASTIIYLLMRQKVDDTELDEVYLEEEDTEDSYLATPPAAPAAPPPGGAPVTMVESPTLRPAPAPPSAPVPDNAANEVAGRPPATPAVAEPSHRSESPAAEPGETKASTDGGTTP